MARLSMGSVLVSSRRWAMGTTVSSLPNKYDGRWCAMSGIRIPIRLVGWYARSRMETSSARWFVLAIGACIAGCGGAEFGAGSDGNAGGAAGSSAQAGSAGSIDSSDAASTNDTGSSGPGGSKPDGSVGAGGAGGRSGAGGTNGGAGSAVCPPCAAPPDPSCVGQGICGCGPYVCADAGKDAAAEAGPTGPQCGEVLCPLGKVCCNALMGICTAPGMTCIQ